MLTLCASCKADAAGWVSVNPATTQHTKFVNIFSLGDASSMPNSKTAAAITSQAPVLVDNLRAHMDGKEMPAVYGELGASLTYVLNVSELTHYVTLRCRRLRFLVRSSATSHRITLTLRAYSPLLTGHNELMLAEFKYGGVPKETFAPILGSQDKPNALYYYLKKDVFPVAYWNAFLKVRSQLSWTFRSER